MYLKFRYTSTVTFTNIKNNFAGCMRNYRDIR